MKNKIYISLILVLLVACGSKETVDTNSLIDQKNVAGLRARQAELVKQNNVIKEELNRVINAIDLLDKDKKRTLITVIPIEENVFSHKVVLQGLVKTDQNLVLNPEFMGTVKTIHTAQGQQVKKGDLLVTIDDGGLAQNAALQKVQLELAKTLFERQQRLWEQKIGSEIEYLQAKANFESQQSAYDQLQKQLSKTKLYAPFSGRVDDVIAEVGELVSPGMNPLLRLINTNNMYVEVEVPESYFASIQKNTLAEVQIPALNHQFQNVVKHKGMHINTGNRTFKISVGIDKSLKLAPNLITTVSLVDYQNPKAISIPLEVISENFEGDQYVYVVDKDTKVKKRFIETGLIEDNRVEVLEGLLPGERIIEEGARLVKENENVQIVSAL